MAIATASRPIQDAQMRWLILVVMLGCGAESKSKADSEGWLIVECFTPDAGPDCSE
jgi:hypothetical protein